MYYWPSDQILSTRSAHIEQRKVTVLKVHLPETDASLGESAAFSDQRLRSLKGYKPARCSYILSVRNVTALKCLELQLQMSVSNPLLCHFPPRAAREPNLTTPFSVVLRSPLVVNGRIITLCVGNTLHLNMLGLILYTLC